MKKFVPILLLPFLLHASFFDSLKNKIEQKALKKTNINNNSVSNTDNIDNNTNNINNTDNIDNNSKIDNNTNNIDNNGGVDNNKNTEIVINNINTKDGVNGKKTVKKNNKKIKHITVDEKLKKILHLEALTSSPFKKQKKEHPFKNSSEIKIVFKKRNTKNQKYEKLIYLKNLLDINVVKKRYDIVFNILNKIKMRQDITKKLKMKFYDYTFWQVIFNYLNVSTMTPKEQNYVCSILSKIINYMDTSYNINTKIDNYIYKVLSHKGFGEGTNLKNLLENFYIYGINDTDIYLKLFKVLSSPLVWRSDVFQLVLYLKQDFISYYNSNNILNETLINYYLKMLLNNNLFNGNTVFNIVKKLKYINPMNSNVYYYLSFYNNDNPKKYISLLKTSIKYNVNNVYSWKSLLKFLLKQRNKKFSSLTKKNKKKLLKYDKYILKLLNYVLNNLVLSKQDTINFTVLKAKIYYLEGTGYSDSDKLLKSAKIYYDLGKYDLVRQIKKYLVAMNPSKSSYYQSLFPKVLY